jgi:hypothetical protein
MNYTRREFAQITLAALPSLSAVDLLAAAKPNSVFGGVRIGVITYSFRALPGSAEEVLKYCVDCGFSGIELMSDVAERFAGSPAQAGRGAGGPAGGGGRGQGRASVTPEQQEARRKRAEDLKNWRLSVPMEKYKAFRKMYEDAAHAARQGDVPAHRRAVHLNDDDGVTGRKIHRRVGDHEIPRGVRQRHDVVPALHPQPDRGGIAGRCFASHERPLS